jgi:hypothetical protein
VQNLFERFQKAPQIEKQIFQTVTGNGSAGKRGA